MYRAKSLHKQEVSFANRLNGRLPPNLAFFHILRSYV